MRVMVIVKATADSEAGVMPSEQLFTEMGNYNEELVNAGIMLSGDGLKPSSAGARVHFSGDKRMVTDGPFAEAKEIIGGYWFIVAGSLQEAAAIAAGNPCLACGLSYEVRPLDVPKISAVEVAEGALAGVESGDEEILVGERALQVKRGLTAQPPMYLTLGRR